ncbi:hypothetical protein [Halorarius halobius]|uniref:hypothetical protein n=1 Tax=Halorarius halobius TaxID=2962671 RepID=UPI0020CE1644|nr:hypothetical protein [Halorarius halobius]
MTTSTDSPTAEAGGSDASHPDTVDDIERWFVVQGLPQFVVDYTATGMVLPRVVPVLTLSFLLTVATTLDAGGSLWRNVAASLAAFPVLVGVWAVANRLRGRPALRLPETVGPVVLGVFLFGPAVLNVLAGRPRVAAVTILGHAVLLAVAYYATSYGLVRMTTGNVRHVFERVELAVRLVGRTFPVLFLTVTFLLFNGNAWESTNSMPLVRYLALLAFFLCTTLAFMYRGVVAEFETRSSFDSPAEIRELCVDSPASRLASTVDVDPAEVPPLTEAERLNVLLLATYGFLGYVVVVTLVMLVFFVLFGLLMLPTEVVADLLDYPPAPVVTVRLFDAPVTLTRELVRVSGFFAAFSGLYFTVHAVTDQTFRKELDGHIATHVRKALAVRAVYRAVQGRSEGSGS